MSKSYKLVDCENDRFGGNYLSCKRNRRLINECKKMGLETFNPVGEWNGYGYDRYPMAVKIRSVGELKKFNKALKNIEAKPKRKVLTEEEKQAAWEKRLAKLSGISMEEAHEIAEDKKQYKNDKIDEMEERQSERYSVRRAKLINKMWRANPLRRIEGEEHAKAILSAHQRHTETPYDFYLKEAHDLEACGLLERGSAKEYALAKIHEERNDEMVS